MVGLIREVEGLVLVMLVERGDHIVPNIKECFPIKSTEEIEKVLNVFYRRDTCEFAGRKFELLYCIIYVVPHDLHSNADGRG